MQTAREFVENYLRNEMRFLEAAAIAFPGGPFEAGPMQDILDVSEFERRAFVVVSGAVEGCRTRYALRRRSYGWALDDVQWQCSLCRRHGRRKKCQLCQGKGWFSPGVRE
jgi:hypothetical protein